MGSLQARILEWVAMIWVRSLGWEDPPRRKEGYSPRGRKESDMTE